MIKQTLTFLLYCVGVVWVTAVLVMMMFTAVRFLKDAAEHLFNRK